MIVYTSEDVDNLKHSILNQFKDNALKSETKWVEKTAINSCTQIVINEINKMIKKGIDDQNSSN